MQQLRASAPGKAVVVGEYAVLSGAPAMSMALNHRARVTVSAGEGDASSVIAPGYLSRRLRFRALPGGAIEWLDALPEVGAHELLCRIWQRAGLAARPAVAMTLDTRPFFDRATGRKIGLGSSAALAIALAAALRTLATGEPPSDYERALHAHRDYQGGKGSGIDIATAHHGGLLRFQQGQANQRLAWPAGLAYRYFWSGSSVSTATKLADMPAGGHDRLAIAAESAIRAMSGDDVADMLAALGDYVVELAAFDRSQRLGIFAAGHRELAEAARTQGDCVYKPCGAGGGDIGIAVAPTDSALTEFSALAKRHGFSALDARLDDQGVRVEVQ